MAALRTPSLALLGIPPLFSFLRPGPARPRTSRTPVVFDAPNVDMGRMLARATVEPELAPIEWDGDRSPNASRREMPPVPVERPSLAEADDACTDAEDPRAYDARRRR